MNRQIIFIPGLFALGILTGIGMMKYRHDQAVEPVVQQPSSGTAPQATVAAVPPARSFAVPSAGTHADELMLLHSKLKELTERVDELEDASASTRDSSMPRELREPGPRINTTVDTPITAATRPVTAERLVMAGVDPVTADEIVRRKTELELKKLELRDAAARGDYLGDRRYMEELRELLEQQVPLREELGDDVYDRYLYANGQANRVRVASVMLGSAADQSGLRDGDLILAYDEDRVFEYSELQQATTSGERDEYVSVTVVRDGETMILWVPRGPLGIRMLTTRIDPDL